MSSVHSCIIAARELLQPKPPAKGVVALLGATALAATASVLLAGVMVLGPGIALQ